MPKQPSPAPTASAIALCPTIYSTELKTQRLIYQKFHSSFHMQTVINLISLLFFFVVVVFFCGGGGDLTFIFPDNSDS